MAGVLIWKSEVEQIEEFKHIKKTRDIQYGQDGFILSAEGIFIYRGIKYLIKVLRYYRFSDGFMPMSTRKSDCHAVVEYPDDTKIYADLMSEIDEYSEFLYHDTLHMYNDDQTIEQQIEECHRLAKNDIDFFFNRSIQKLNEKIQYYNDLKRKIMSMKLLELE